MTIGLALLGVVAVLIFFGVAERFFRKIGISNWLAFILVFALVVGAVVPSIKIGGGFSMNISGFLIPVALVVLFSVIIGVNSDLMRAFISMIGVAGVAVATRMLIMPTSFAYVVTASVIVGFVGGSVAYLIGMTRLVTLLSAVGGIVLGDIIVNFINRFILTGSTFALGSSGVFDSIIIAAVTGAALVEAITALKRTMNRKQLSKGVLGAEAGEDSDMASIKAEAAEDNEDFSDYFKEE